MSPTSGRTEIERALDDLASRTTFGLCFIVVFALTVLGALAWYGHQQGKQADALKAVATETHGALCSFKGDLQHRFDANLKLLQDHPEDPVRAYGLVIPRGTLASSVSNQKATLKALAPLDCSND